MSGKAAFGKEKEPEANAGPVEGISIKTGSTDEKPTVSGGDKKYHFTDGKAWPQPPDRLINDKVLYKCTLLGAMEVKEGFGSDIVKDAVDRLRLVADVKRSDGSAMPEVEISICIRSISITDLKSKLLLYKHPLHQISFCAEDRRELPIAFAYICKTKPRENIHTCFVYETTGDDAEIITTTIGQAFQMAYERYQETRQAQRDFMELKERLQSKAEKEEFTQQLQRLKKQVELMELESKRKQRPALEKFPSVIAKWESIVHALEPFTVEPGLDPNTAYMVPRPETQELDSAISLMESQIQDLNEGFGRQLTVDTLAATPKIPDFSARVMSDVEGQIRNIQAQNRSLDEPELPANYQMEEYIQAKRKASLPKKGAVMEAAKQWPPDEL